MGQAHARRDALASHRQEGICTLPDVGIGLACIKELSPRASRDPVVLAQRPGRVRSLNALGDVFNVAEETRTSRGTAPASQTYRAWSLSRSVVGSSVAMASSAASAFRCAAAVASAVGESSATSSSTIPA